MKVEFQANGFVADMNDEPKEEKKEASLPLNESVFKEYMGLIFGILALLVAFTLLPLGLVATAGADFFQTLFGFFPLRYTLFHIVAVIVILILSAAFAVISLVGYTKSKRKNSDLVGLVLAIIAFAVDGLGVLVNSIMLLL
ncbi:MAG: hypothetical protein E7668_05845 [Ruminococcaceae bacterium]|nr:hypothetical protein [Oscillospiraceae bacterium]